jgi:23S rRNA (cytosine1962-C5)-methyltransferase
MLNNTLTPNVQIEQDFIVAHKPHGLNTHSQDRNEWGFVEWLSKKINQNLFVFQRLDQTTSGVLLFARTKEAATILTNKWKASEVEKRYLFITDRISKETHFTCNHNIDSKEAQTQFELLKNFKQYTLWAAYPKTGRPHQIRKHATACGIPLLGDSTYGGSAFFRVCLHAESLSLPWLNTPNKIHSATVPLFFEDLTLLSNEPLCQMLDAVQQRIALYKPESILESESFRWTHTDGPNIRMDQFGSQFWFYDYNQKINFNLIKLFLTEVQKIKSLQIPKSGFIRSMTNSKPASELVLLNSPENIWTCTENGVHYELRSQSGMSPGLFLDQRANREWVRSQSKNKKVLNLFSYTGGFSVNAALGGASQVTTVDLSANFIDWSKRNFELNHIPLENHEFWTADVLNYLKGSLKRNRKFDLIICDPPSFGRTKKTIFRIEDEIDTLIGMLIELLAPNGKILFSTNYEKWSLSDFSQVLGAAQLTTKWSPSPFPELDFERHSSNRLMKSFIFNSN